MSGCLTLTIPRRTQAPSAGKVLLIYGSGAGAFPSSALKCMPGPLLDAAEFVCQRMPLSHYPLDHAARLEVEAYARGLLDRYASTSRLVVTPLHHAATPCMALGIPVIICRSGMDTRFSFLRELLPVHTPDTFPAIDWDPEPVNVEPHRQRLESLVARSIGR